MKYHTFVVSFILILFPVKILSHNRIIEIVNMSISGNINTITALCKIVESQKSNKTETWNNLSFTICIVQTLNSSKTKDFFCKSSTFKNQTRSNCDRTILSQINSDLGMSQYNQFVFDVSKRIFATFQWNKFDRSLKSNEIEIDKNIKKLSSDTFRFNMTVNTTLDVSMIFRRRCMDNYYGTNCENLCESMDNISGHYKCTDDGKRVCLPGWRGTNCNEAICNVCVNGQCSAPWKCNCFNGWSGETCSECQKRRECMHGTCDSGVPFTCKCMPGWGGQFCDIDLEYCLNHQGLCQNNGKCHSYYKDSRLQYMCTCEPGYSGRHCQIITGDCIYPNCNSKNCLKEMPAPKCKCFPGSSGSFCQINNTIQLEFQSLEKNMKSGGFCLNPDEGYSCSCSKTKVEICQCTFNKCPNNSICNSKSTLNKFCSANSDINLKREFYINFGLEHFSLSSVITKKPQTDYKFIKDPYFKFYIGSFVFISILLAVLLFVVIKFAFKFRKKSKACVKTIHNDLCLPNNLVHKSVNFPEQRFLLHQIPLSTSSANDKCLNNIFVIQDPGISDSKCKDVTWESQESLNYDKSTRKNPIVFNPNLLINNYKDLHENVK